MNSKMDTFTNTDHDVLRTRLEALPDSIKGEIIGDTLYTMPKARLRHMRASTFIGHFVGGAYDFDEDGPGGWWIAVEPGIRLPGAGEVIPDLAGWRRTTMPEFPPPKEPVRIAPDWTCEVLSPSSVGYDFGPKLAFYGNVGVSWYWIVDPEAPFILVFEHINGVWVIRASATNEEKVRLPPFEEVEIPVNRMWIP